MLVEDRPPLVGAEPEHVVGVVEVAVVLGELRVRGVRLDLGVPVVAPVLAELVLGEGTEALSDEQQRLVDALTVGLGHG